MLAIKRWSSVPGEADASCSRHCPDRGRRFPAPSPRLCTPGPAPAGPAQVPRTGWRSRHGHPAGSGAGPAGPPPSPRGAPPPPAERCQATGRCFSDRNGKSAAGVGGGGREMAGLGLPAGAREAPPAPTAPKNPERRSSRCSPAQPKLPRTPKRYQGKNSALGPPAWPEDGAGTA